MVRLSSDQATRWTRFGVIGVVVGVVFLVGVFFVPMPDPEIPDPEPTVQIRPIRAQEPRAASGADVEREHMDWREAATRLAWAGTDPVERQVATGPDPAEEPAPGDEGEPNAEDERAGGETLAAAPPNWRYLGAIRAPDAIEALVAIDGRQQIVAEGQRVAVGTGEPDQIYDIVEIDEQRVVIAQGRNRYEVARAEPTAVVLLRGAANFEARERFRNAARPPSAPRGPAGEDANEAARSAAQEARDRARREALEETLRRKRNFRPPNPFAPRGGDADKQEETPEDNGSETRG